jgi:predicted DCC family thiol-disulfide oxidoreductase YuxK
MRENYGQMDARHVPVLFCRVPDGEYLEEKRNSRKEAPNMKKERVVLFDGTCNFCDKSVQFIIKRDPVGHFKYASLQSDVGQELREKHKIPEEVDSMVLIEGDKAYTKSTAALHIAKKLDGLWHLAFLFIVVPKPLRDRAYDYIAENRFKWFGKKTEEEACRLPPKNIRERFLA